MAITWKVDHLTGLDRETWISLERSGEPGTCCAFQTLEWGEVLYKINNQASLFVTFFSDRALIGGLRFWETGTHWFPFLSSADGPLCITGSENELSEGIARFMKSIGRRYASNRLELLPSFSGSLDIHNLERVNSPFFSFIISLQLDEGSLWTNLQKKTRWGISKAKNNGLQVRVLTSRENWLEFQRIQKKHYDEKGYSGSFSSSFVEEMYDTLRPQGLCSLFGCFLDEKMIGACLLRTLNGYAIYYRGVTVREFRSLAPMDILQWQSILWAKNNGYLFYDLGGISPSDPAKSGLWRYKSKWGGKPSLIPEYSTSLLFRMFSVVNARTTGVRRLRNIFARISTTFSPVSSM